MNKYKLSKEDKQFKKLLTTDIRRLFFFDNIFEDYLMPKGYIYQLEVPFKKSDQLLIESGMALQQFDEQAYSWSYRLIAGEEIPKDKYDLIYAYCKYLLYFRAEWTARGYRKARKKSDN